MKRTIIDASQDVYKRQKKSLVTVKETVKASK